MKNMPHVLACWGLLLFTNSLFAAAPDGYRLAWSDEFDGTALDTNKWMHWLPGKRRDAINTSNAIAVLNGLLTITSYTEDGKHFTGMISTQRKFAPIRGYWEARIRFDDSQGMWSAFWLQSPTMGRPIGDTAAAGIEIDICEHRSVDKNGNNMVDKVSHNLHWDGYGRGHRTAGRDTRDLKLGTGFHDYGFEWTTNAYRFFADGQLTWTVTNAISNAKEFCILSSEIDGKAWAGKIPDAGYGDLRASKTKMVVDWVRYYATE